MDLNVLHSQIVKKWILVCTIKIVFWWQNFSEWKFKIPSFEFILEKTRRSKLPQFDVGTYTVECGVVDFVGEVECPSDVVVVSVGFAEVVGVGFLVVVLKVLVCTYFLSLEELALWAVSHSKYVLKVTKIYTDLLYTLSSLMFLVSLPVIC